MALRAGLLVSPLKYPNASAALMYFLTKGELGGTNNVYKYEEPPYTTNHTMREISATVAIHENKPMKEKFRKNIEGIIKIVNKLNIENGSRVILNNDSEDSSIAQDEDIGKEEDVDKDTDWYATLGKYRIKIEAVITKNENKYELKIRYGIVDYYDWLNDKNYETYEEIFGDTTGFIKDKLFDELRMMNRAGIARNYTNFGETLYTLTWNEGEQVAPIV